MKWIVVVLLALALALALACDMPTDGSDGAPGANGVDGINGVNGTNGADGKDGQDGTSAYASDIGTLTAATRSNITGTPCWIVYLGTGISTVLAVYTMSPITRYWEPVDWKFQEFMGNIQVKIMDGWGVNGYSGREYRIDYIREE